VTIPEEKALLRTQARLDRRNNISSADYSILLSAPEISSAEIIASYHSYGDEPHTDQLNSALLAEGKILLLPRISGQLLEWVRWSQAEGSLMKNGKIHEPVGPAFTELSKVKVMIVPALLIDKSGYRLGQGGGYYDRALKEFDAWKVGLIWENELCTRDLPREVHDLPLDAACSPASILRFNS